MKKENIRNIAIVAHVDHGKTTLVDAMLRQSGVFRENEAVEERVMDSTDIERERGITILAKNTSLMYGGYKINIIDTPGHADFGGEVERALKMADGILLLVDAFEGCMPQTRYVLKKALTLNLKPIIVVNKIDRPNARPYEVVDEVLELLIDLDATDEQLDSPVIYASARGGYTGLNPEIKEGDLKCLFDLIVESIPSPEGEEGDFQMLVSNIDYNEYTGRIGIGKIRRGRTEVNMPVTICREGGSTANGKITRLYTYNALEMVPVESGGAGDIVAIAGLADINIGETICAFGRPDPLPFTKIDRPVLSMTFSVNDSPFAGREGEFVTSRHLRDRLYRELLSNISLEVEDTDSTESFIVSGRGELHLSVLIENMRRQGYEFQVSRPRVITKTVEGQIYEPVERMTIDVPEEFTGAVMESVGTRKAELLNMETLSNGLCRLEFKIPARGIAGFRDRLLTQTRGNGVLSHVFDSYESYKGEIPSRNRGSLVAFEDGEAAAYGIFNAQERGEMFISPGDKVYEGMVVGESSRQEDIAVNVCKRKHSTNMRAAGSDEALRLTPPRNMSLEQCINFIGDDELLEVTPKSLRIRKKILRTELRLKKKKNE